MIAPEGYELGDAYAKDSTGILYRAVFDTTPGEWQVVDIPFGRFIPTFRGRIVRDAPALDLSRVTSFGLMISDNQAGPFTLEVQWIDAYR